MLVVPVVQALGDRLAGKTTSFYTREGTSEKPIVVIYYLGSAALPV